MPNMRGASRSPCVSNKLGGLVRNTAYAHAMALLARVVTASQLHSAVNINAIKGHQV